MSDLRSTVRETALKDPGFCRYRTDHTLVLDWTAQDGWSRPSFPDDAGTVMDPATLVLHYGQAVFEGLKACRQPDGSAALFRPYDHARRMRRSTARLAMTSMPVDLFVESCAALASVDDGWIPGALGQSLYLRPIMVASETELALRPSNRYRTTVMAYPADPCYGLDFRPLSVLVAEDHVRAARGGTGEAKCAGNYAASLLTRSEAVAAGYDEVLWLDGVERHWVEELSTMNVFFVWRDGDGVRITTPPCGGTIVRGVTRDSMIVLARDTGLPVSEDPVDIGTVLDGAASGRLVEMFACGTAAVVVPVGRIATTGRKETLGDGAEGALTAQLRRALVEVQCGIRPDQHGWLVPVPKGRTTTDWRNEP